MTDKNQWVELCQLEDIQRRGSRTFPHDGMTIAVFRTQQDEVFAIEDKCPHLGGALSEGIIHETQVTCPLHNLIIDLKTGQAVAPDTGCVLQFPVELKEGTVLIDLEAKAQKVA